MPEQSLDNIINGVQGKFWNYGNQQKDDYRPELVGTLTKVSISQAHEFGHPENKSYWSDGNPVIMVRMHIKDAEGDEFLFDVKPKSTMWFEDLQPACPGGSLNNLLGKMIRLTFCGQVPVPKRSVNRNKFQLQVIGDGQWPSEGFDPTMPPTRQEAAGQQAQRQQPQQQAPQMPQYIQSPQQYQAQRMVNGPQPQGYQIPPQPTYPQPGQPMNQAMQAAYNAAAAAGFTAPQQPTFQGVQPMAPQPVAPQPVQEDQPPVDLYDNDIPF